mmetsp:Transcript_21336/g.48113  ORF Transcript_21336/g.48113 Transcript_21336/m.48113 type:complete len:234 (-) Transcript_21336:225-926(-)
MRRGDAVEHALIPGADDVRPIGLEGPRHGGREHADPERGGRGHGRLGTQRGEAAPDPAPLPVGAYDMGAFDRSAVIQVGPDPSLGPGDSKDSGSSPQCNPGAVGRYLLEAPDDAGPGRAEPGRGPGDVPRLPRPAVEERHEAPLVPGRGRGLETSPPPQRRPAPLVEDERVRFRAPRVGLVGAFEHDGRYPGVVQEYRREQTGRASAADQHEWLSIGCGRRRHFLCCDDVVFQ